MALATAKIALEDALLKHIEEQVSVGVDWLRLFVETLGALVIAVGVLVVIAGLVRHALAPRHGSFQPIRHALARYLLLALELQLAADILSTALAPTWDRIGKLAAIAIIRTALNYFLIKEMRDDRVVDEPASQQQPERPRPSE